MYPDLATTQLLTGLKAGKLDLSQPPERATATMVPPSWASAALCGLAGEHGSAGQLLPSICGQTPKKWGGQRAKVAELPTYRPASLVVERGEGGCRWSGRDFSQKRMHDSLGHRCGSRDKCVHARKKVRTSLTSIVEELDK